MSISERDSKTVRVPSFNGKNEAFQICWVRFKAHGKMTRFVKALEETPETDLPSNHNEVENLIGTDDDAKKKKKAADRNDSAMASLTLAFETDELIAMILSS